ncbi:hypothetical protein FHR22_000153 [Sphingopyxis panaciterrae]|uniref:hypothetical protein n=1 Tax=Sphingopyxis panaciterrae TaxID=363841 RepID=UPI001ABB1FF8|nr:hypothetical protein [Sphingopyxis panaciterrae]NIJ35504.1 hypothetical protein [Sphingopyxis panaciterrae]
MRYIILIALGVCAALAPAASRAEPQGSGPCAYDREAMLRLDRNSFDQDDELGWRKLGNRAECRTVAADLIALYIEAHRDELARVWQIPSFKWHEATTRAFAGDRARAIALMHQSLKPEAGPREFEGWTAYALPWNDYVKATIAFLERDAEALAKARERLAASPVPDDFSKTDISAATGIAASWPPNLGVVDGLIACFDRPYLEAYGSIECREAGKRR